MSKAATGGAGGDGGLTVAEAVRAAVAPLRRAGVEGPARDARLLMAFALGCPVDRLTLREREPLAGPAAARFRAVVAARAERRPLSQVLGRRAFWGRDFAVTPDVLDPRPETETLVAAALAGPPAARLLDLGTGSGAILLTLLAEWPGATGTGADASPAALAVAAANAAALRLGPRAAFVLSDWTAAVTGAFDLVLCNPPYIAEADLARLAPEVRDWEPRAALTPGPTGLEAHARLAAGLGRVMAPGGRGLLEIGAGQQDAVAALFREAGFDVPALHRDLDGRVRVVEVAAPPRP